ncbi:MDC1 protein, partial [Dromas ardeola]|nr:MDC1 protein [Dromas ardeola]
AMRGQGQVEPRPPAKPRPRLQAPPPPPPEPMGTRGRGQMEPRPLAKPRPRQTGPAHLQEEEEPPEVTGHQLRPRGGPGSAPPKVLFTGVVASPDMEVALRTLGGSMATSVFDCTHLVTDRVRRTVKFLCAVARGVPIVTPEWLHKVPWGRGTGEGDLGDRERAFGDRKEDLGVMGVLGDRAWGFWGQGEVSWGHGSSWGQGEGPWGHEIPWGYGTGMGSLGTRFILG